MPVVQRQRVSQQQAVGPGLVFEQSDDLIVATLVEQKIRPGAKQIAVGSGERQGAPEVRFGGRGVAQPSGHFGEQGQDPDLHARVGIAAAFKRVSQRQITGPGAAAQAGHIGQTGAHDQVGSDAIQMRATFFRLFKFTLHLQHGSPGDPCLAIAAVGFEQEIEVCQRLRKTMGALQNRCAQHQHLDRRIGLIPPRRQRRLGVTQITRIGIVASQVDIAPCQIGGDAQIARFALQSGTQIR